MNGLEKKCSFCCTVPEVFLNSSPAPASIKGLELLFKILDIPHVNLNSLCGNCRECLRQIYEYQLEIKVLQLKIGDKIKDLQIAVMESRMESPNSTTQDSQQFATLFVDKCKKFRQNASLPTTSMVDIVIKPSFQNTDQPTQSSAREAINLPNMTQPMYNFDDEETSSIYNGLPLPNETEGNDLVEVKLEETEEHNDFNNITEFVAEVRPEDLQTKDNHDDDESGDDPSYQPEDEPSAKRLKIEKVQGSTLDCPHCDRKDLKTEKNLKNHITAKHNTTPITCQICSKTFKRKDHLVRHIKTVHEKQQRYVCKYSNCLMRFSYRIGLGKHLTEVHGENE